MYSLNFCFLILNQNYQSGARVQRTLFIHLTRLTDQSISKHHLKTSISTFYIIARLFHNVSFKPFYIALNSQNTSGEIDLNPDNEVLLEEMNKNMLFYYFCVDVRDFVFQKLDSKGVVSYVSLPKYICLKTYCPCFDLYRQILKEIFGRLNHKSRLRWIAEEHDCKNG